MMITLAALTEGYAAPQLPLLRVSKPGLGQEVQFSANAGATNFHGSQGSNVQPAPFLGTSKLYGVFSNFEDHPHPPDVPVKHTVARIDMVSGAKTNLGPATAGGAIGQSTGGIGKDGALYTLNNFYDGGPATNIHVRVEKHSMSDGSFLGQYPVAGVPFMLWTSFGQQMVMDGDTPIVLAPTVNKGGYVFTYSIFSVDVAANTSKLVKAIGDYMVTPTDAAGFPAAMSSDGAMAAILADAASQQNVLLELSTKDGSLLRTVAAPPVANLAAGGGAIWGGGGQTPTLYKLAAGADHFEQVAARHSMRDAAVCHDMLCCRWRPSPSSARRGRQTRRCWPASWRRATAAPSCTRRDRTGAAAESRVPAPSRDVVAGTVRWTCRSRPTRRRSTRWRSSRCPPRARAA